MSRPSSEYVDRGALSPGAARSGMNAKIAPSAGFYSAGLGYFTPAALRTVRSHVRKHCCSWPRGWCADCNAQFVRSDQGWNGSVGGRLIAVEVLIGGPSTSTTEY